MLWEPTKRLEGWDCQSHPLTSEEGERGWRLTQSPMANDLVNCDCVMKPLKNPRGQGSLKGEDDSGIRITTGRDNPV